MKQQFTKPLTAVLNPTPSIELPEQVKDALTNMAQLHESLINLRKAGFAQMPETRSLKIIAQSRESQSKPFNFIPEITLKGNWLEEAGFECEQRVRVITMHQMLVICPEAPAVVGKKKRRIV